MSRAGEEIEAIRQVREVLLGLYQPVETTVSSSARSSGAAVTETEPGRRLPDRPEGPGEGTRAPAAIAGQHATSEVPSVREVLSSMSSLGAALERLGRNDPSHQRFWDALEVMQRVVEHWLLAGAPSDIAAPAPPPPVSESEYLRKTESHLQKLLESRRETAVNERRPAGRLLFEAEVED